MCDHELNLVIQEEIGRLPEKYRAAVVLCYLEGLTHEMAAERLGWPVGSVKSRLAWARERLRVRLTRRGVAPTTLPFDRSGSSTRRGTGLPFVLGTRLADATLRGALKAGMGKGALVGIVSAEAVALMEGIIKSMTNAKLMLMAMRGFDCRAGDRRRGRDGVFRNSPGESPARKPSRPGSSPTGRGRSGHAGRRRCRQTGHGSRSPHDPGRSRRSGGSPSVRGRCRRDGLVCAQLRERRVGHRANREAMARVRSSSRSLANARERELHSGSVWAYQPGRAIARDQRLVRQESIPDCGSPDPGSTGEMDHHRPRPG